MSAQPTQSTNQRIQSQSVKQPPSHSHQPKTTIYMAPREARLIQGGQPKAGRKCCAMPHHALHASKYIEALWRLYSSAAALGATPQVRERQGCVLLLLTLCFDWRCAPARCSSSSATRLRAALRIVCTSAASVANCACSSSIFSSSVGSLGATSLGANCKPSIRTKTVQES